jgi:hypothetical protein
MTDTHPFLTHLSRCSACAVNIVALCPEGYRLLTVEVMESGSSRQVCTCLGTCRGAEGLGEGWVCALERANHGMAQHEVRE